MIIITMIMRKEGKNDFSIRYRVFFIILIKIVLNVSRKMLIIPLKYIFITV